MRIDSTDLRLLNLLTKNPGISQVELARELNITQPAVSMRLKKLKKYGILGGPSIDVKKMGLKLILALSDKKPTKEILEHPYFLTAFRTDKSYIYLFAAENYETAESVAKMLLNKVDILKVDEIFGKIGFEIRLPRNTKDCSNCMFFMKFVCLGFPGSKDYRGKLWK